MHFQVQQNFIYTKFSTRTRVFFRVYEQTYDSTQDMTFIIIDTDGGHGNIILLITRKVSRPRQAAHVMHG